MAQKFPFDETGTDNFAAFQVEHKFDELSRKIIGAAIEVHRELGPGFLENIYEEALKLEFTEHDLTFESQKEIKIKYLDTVIGSHRLDLLVENRFVVELKAVKELNDIHFAKPTLEIKRVVN